MSEGYTLRWFQEDDLDTYIDGLNESLFDRYDRKRFQWKFGDNPFNLGFTSIVVAVDDESGRLVGFNSFLPLEISIGEKIVPIVQGCDGYVHRDHRRRGIFMATINFMEEELPSAGSMLLMGFNFASSTAAAVKAGSTAVCEVNYWELEPKALRGQGRPSGSFSIKEIDVMEAHSLYSVWRNDVDQSHIHRSLEYMRWRFEDSPLRDYRFYSLKEGDKVLGYMVLSVAENDEGETIVGLDDYILSLSNPSAVIGAMAELIKLEEDASRIELLTKRGGEIEDPLRRLNVEPEPRYTMILKPISGSGPHGGTSESESRALLREDWHVTTSDIY
jgi:GNAT superfamily N-acetyltransferase